MGQKELRNRLLILERAFDKAVKGTKLAELEERILRDAIWWSAKKAKLVRRSYRDHIWKRFGWDTPEGEAKWKQIRNIILRNVKEKDNGESI